MSIQRLSVHFLIAMSVVSTQSFALSTPNGAVRSSVAFHASRPSEPARQAWTQIRDAGQLTFAEAESLISNQMQVSGVNSEDLLFAAIESHDVSEDAVNMALREGGPQFAAFPFLLVGLGVVILALYLRDYLRNPCANVAGYCDPDFLR